MSKYVRCSAQVHFYVKVNDNASPDEIEDAIDTYIAEIENFDDMFAIDDYDWEEWGY
jgi:hypothetical protein